MANLPFEPLVQAQNVVRAAQAHCPGLIAAYLHGRGVRTDFCETNWPRFLDAAAIILTPDGRRQYALVRAGLSDRCCGV